MELEWQGHRYPIPLIEPAQARDLDGLHYFFRVPLESYVDFARKHTGLDLRIGECRRSLERQVWLLSQGRVNGNRIRSWVLDSRHRWGVAADLILVNANGEAVWDTSSWESLYEQVPPSWFGLKSIAPLEWVHLEFMAADDLIKRGGDFGLVQS